MWTVIATLSLVTNLAFAAESRVPDAALAAPVLPADAGDTNDRRFRAGLLLGAQGMVLVPLTAVAGWALGDALSRGVSMVRGETLLGPVPFALSITSAALSFLPLLWLSAPDRAPAGPEAWWLALLHAPSAALTVAFSILVWTNPAWSIAVLVAGSVLTGVVDAWVLGSALRFESPPTRPGDATRDP